MAKNREYREVQKQDAETQKVPLLQRLYAMAASGLSKRSMAAKIGFTLEEFQDLLNYKEKGIQRYQMAYDAGRAVFEEENIAVLEQVLETGSEGIKAKIARDNLKTLEEWAPATKSVKVIVEDAANVLLFEALSEEDQNAIKASHTPNDDTEEDQTSED
ncbi:hypothetical protein [Sapientia aquatica]|jgi:hypothetical protein|uniref:Uncharacterized protein n=1 Tax=Sapientia aquatica TaxID=1549640 RepID=A0A4V3AU85_9BURK|nr:hypothetical protein [Sapientia aquatica]TDK63543.1 hypothetical protein E2I14_15190 [Sapientia aquatica]